MKSNALVLTKKEFDEFLASNMNQLDYEIVREQDVNDEIIIMFNQEEEFDVAVDFFKRLAADNRLKEIEEDIKRITDKLNLRRQRLNDIEEEIADLKSQLKKATLEKQYIVDSKDKKVDHKYEDEDSENEAEIKEFDINDIFDLLFGSTVTHSPKSDEGVEDGHNCVECPNKHMCSNRK